MYKQIEGRCCSVKDELRSVLSFTGVLLSNVQNKVMVPNFNTLILGI